jgi:hypothetical protein
MFFLDIAVYFAMQVESPTHKVDAADDEMNLAVGEAPDKDAEDKCTETIVLPVDATANMFIKIEREMLTRGTSYDTAEDTDEIWKATEIKENADRNAACTDFENNDESETQYEKLVADFIMRAPGEGALILN